MSALQRNFIIAAIAMWLPLCCCQVMAIVAPGDACCADSSAKCCDDRATDECCDDRATDACCDEAPVDSQHSDQSCACCVEKGPPPTAPSFDSFFVAIEIPFEVAHAQLLIDPTEIRAWEIAGRWDVPPPTDSPAPPHSASERCSIFSIWLI